MDFLSISSELLPSFDNSVIVRVKESEPVEVNPIIKHVVCESLTHHGTRNKNTNSSKQRPSSRSGQEFQQTGGRKQKGIGCAELEKEQV